MNAGVYAYDERALRDALARIDNTNAQGEYYLTDTIALLAAEGRVVPVVAPDYRVVLGINDRVELAASARGAQRPGCVRQHMREGVTIVDPATTYLEPGLHMGAPTRSCTRARRSAGAHADRQRLFDRSARARSTRATIGDARAASRERGSRFDPLGAGRHDRPFAHLRGGNALGHRVRIGNFVETKNRLPRRRREGESSCLHRRRLRRRAFELSAPARSPQLRRRARRTAPKSAPT